jgi:hypothetical protein
MTTGRKPKPTALKLLHGDARRGINLHEPEHASIDPAWPPDELTDFRARAEWERVIPTLARGHVTTGRSRDAARDCLKYGQWLALEAEASKHPYIVKGVNNGPKQWRIDDRSA